MPSSYLLVSYFELIALVAFPRKKPAIGVKAPTRAAVITKTIK